MSTRSALSVLAAAALVAVIAPASAFASASCRDIKNPYEGTKFEGADLTGIRASHVSCKRARYVVKKSHLEALASFPDSDGIVRVSWHEWAVRGDLKPSSDRYTAKHEGAQIRWRF